MARTTLHSVVMSTFDALKLGRAANPYQQQAASPYLKQDRSGWTVDNDAVSAVSNRYLKSDVISDRIQALDLYQCHETLTLLFRTVVHKTPGGSFASTIRARGALLTALFAYDLELQIEHNRLSAQTHKYYQGESSDYSVQKMLSIMDRYTVERKSSEEPWHLDPLPKQIRDWLTWVFKADLPPSSFHSWFYDDAVFFFD